MEFLCVSAPSVVKNFPMLGIFVLSLFFVAIIFVTCIASGDAGSNPWKHPRSSVSIRG